MTDPSTPDPTPPGGLPPEPEPEQGFLRELSQFFVVPSLIVLLCVGIFVMFGLLTHEGKSVREFLQVVRSSSGADRWQAAFEMSRAIAQDPSAASDPRLVEEIAAAIGREGREDPRVRKYLVIALEHLRSRAAGPVLIECLKDADPEVRLQAARALGVIGSVSGAAAPLAELLAEEDPALRKVAIYAIGQTRDPSAVPTLQPRLEDPIEDIRWNAALALAVLHDDSGRAVIGQMLDRRHLDAVAGITEEQKVAALVNGVHAVFLLQDATFAATLKDLSQNDPSLKVREIALQALKALPAGADS